MLNTKTTILAAALLVLGSIGVAQADCMQEGQCFDTYQGVTLGGSSSYGGFGAGVFDGEEGVVLIEKTGYANTDTKLSITGDLCGADCQNGSFTHEASSGEWVSSMVGAYGTAPGDTVSAINEGAAFTNVTFEFGKVNISPANQ